VKIHVLSDIHQEFGPLRIPPVDCDVVVLAGDVNLGQYPLVDIEPLSRRYPIIFVLGNHEFYNNDLDKTISYWASCVWKNIIVLENEVAIIKGVRFIGATLWTDMNRGDKEAMDAARTGMNDYRIVKLGSRTLTPEDTIERFTVSKAFIQQELERPFEGKTVVVTHHLPSYKSIAPPFADDPLNPCFASDLEDLIKEHRPTLWIHGHTHSSVDYNIGETRVICNPRGYAGREVNPAFRKDFVIEI
jgi:Icc-related predicted phosphoesterase